MSFKNVHGNEILNLTFVNLIFLRLTFCYLSIPGSRQRFTMNTWLLSLPSLGETGPAGSPGPALTASGLGNDFPCFLAAVRRLKFPVSRPGGRVPSLPHPTRDEALPWAPLCHQGSLHRAGLEHPHAPQPAGSSPLTHLLLTQCISLGPTCFYTVGLLFLDGCIPHP